MKKYILTLSFMLFASFALAEDIQLFNTQVLQSNTSDPIVPIIEQNQNELAPKSVTLDVKNGHYIAATVVYPKEFKLAEVKANLNRHYQTYESELTQGKDSFGLWRNEKDKYAIQLTTDEDGDILVLYVNFIGNNQ